MTTRKTPLRSQDLSCPSCVAKIERALETMDGVQNAEVFFSTGRIVVEHDPDVVKPAELVKQVGSVGYDAKVAPF